MKKSLFFLILFLAAGKIAAQDNLGILLTSGLEDTRTFAEDYIRPGTEGAIHNLSNGWYKSAEVKKILGFELSVIGNASTIKEDQQTFELKTEQYHNLRFSGGETSREVATIFGPSDPTEVFIEYESPSGTEEASFLLPQGMGASGIDFVPAVFLQARMGVSKGTELKFRYFPKRTYDKVEAELYGGAIQHELTSWLPGSEDWPIAVAGIVGYTKMQGSYDFTAQQYLEGVDQRLNAGIDSWLFSAIVSTKMKVINFYGGIGSVMGSSETEMLGTYSVVDDSGRTLVTVEDPLTMSRSLNGMRMNLGMSLKLGFFKIHADYNFQKYQTLSVGLHFGI